MQLPGVKRWLNVDLPRVRSRRVDLLGRTTTGRLLHLELQGQNDHGIPLRMAEYGLAIFRAYLEYPIQVVIYVGKRKLRMKSELRTSGLVCKFRLVDIRDLDATALLSSPSIADNIMGVLVGLNDAPGGIRKLLRRITRLKKSQQEDAFQQLLVTCRLRDLREVAEKEAQNMPVNFAFDVTEYKFIADEVKRGRERGRQQGLQEGRREGLQEGRREGRQKGLEQGLEQGLQQGLQQGRKEGLLEGNRELVLSLLRKRFGRLPASVTRRIARMSHAQTEELAVAVLDARSLKDLFGSVRR